MSYADRGSGPRWRARGLLPLVITLLGCAANEAPPVFTTPFESASSPKRATEFDVRLAELVAKNPAGVELFVATQKDRRRFAEGEIIELELRFTSTEPEAHSLDLASYDRSGRLPSERFLFDPAAGVSDPLRDYFEGRGMMFGGLRPLPAILSQVPRSVRVVLNEWARFEGAGSYRVIVQSTRVGSTKGASPSGEGRTITAKNLLELEIVSDVAFAEEALTRLQPVVLAGDEEARGRARYALRFLMSEAATRAKVDDLCRVRVQGDDARWNTEAGLYGVADRKKVIALLEQRLASPDCAVTPEYLALLTRLKSIASGIPRDAPSYATNIETPVLSALMRALPTKSKEGRATSLYTALTAVGEERGAGLNSPEAEALRRALAADLSELPERSLQSLLGDAWPLLRSPTVGGALLKLVKEARPRGGQLRSISDLALERLLEVDPAAARSFIVDELGRGARSSFSGETLGRLMDKELPAVEATLVSGLNAKETDGVSLELRAEVFARYATKASLESAWVAWKASPYFRVSLLSYLSRHDPAAANAEIRRIEDIDSLTRLARFMWSPTLESAVIEKLSTPGGAAAAALLGERGGPGAEKALWTGLKTGEPSLTSAIRRALSTGKAWMLGPDRLRMLAATCKDETCRREVARDLDCWGKDGTRPALVLWSIRPSGGVTGWLGHYEIHSLTDVERRIGQLPAGVALAWQTKAANVDREVLQKIERWAAAKKVELLSSP